MGKGRTNDVCMNLMESQRIWLWCQQQQLPTFSDMFLNPLLSTILSKLFCWLFLSTRLFVFELILLPLKGCFEQEEEVYLLMVSANKRTVICILNSKIRIGGTIWCISKSLVNHFVTSTFTRKAIPCQIFFAVLASIFEYISIRSKSTPCNLAPRVVFGKVAVFISRREADLKPRASEEDSLYPLHQAFCQCQNCTLSQFSEFPGQFCKTLMQQRTDKEMLYLIFLGN